MSLDSELMDVFPEKGNTRLNAAAKALKGESGFADATETLTQERMYLDGEAANNADYAAREIAAETVKDVYDRTNAVANHTELAVDLVQDTGERKEIRKLGIKSRKMMERIESNFPQEVYDKGEVPVQPYRASD